MTARLYSALSTGHLIGLSHDAVRFTGATPLRGSEKPCDFAARPVPVRNEVPRSVINIAISESYGPRVTHVPDVTCDDSFAYGAYLSGPVGHCIECHTPMRGSFGFKRGIAVYSSYVHLLARRWLMTSRPGGPLKDRRPQLIRRSPRGVGYRRCALTRTQSEAIFRKPYDGSVFQRIGRGTTLGDKTRNRTLGPAGGTAKKNI